MIVGSVVLVVVAISLGAVLWQHQRYLKVRRVILGDLQPLLYPARTFHAVLFVRVDLGRSVIDDVRVLRRWIDSAGGGRVVYVGQVGLAMVTSNQLPNDWSAVILVQYPSRKVHDEFIARQEYCEALAGFANVYSHGIVRPPVLNLLLPQGLLLLRLRDILLRVPSSFPFVPVGDEANPRLRAKMKEIETLDTLREINEEAVVIFNLIQPGDRDQRRADRGYTLKMIRAMAEGGYGPMHMGEAVTVEGSAEFEKFFAVYYPGIDFMQEMIGSTFMSRIGGGKQLGDSLAVATVPVLSML